MRHPDAFWPQVQIQIGIGQITGKDHEKTQNINESTDSLSLNKELFMSADGLQEKHGIWRLGRWLSGQNISQISMRTKDQITKTYIQAR